MTPPRAWSQTRWAAGVVASLTGLAVAAGVLWLSRWRAEPDGYYAPRPDWSAFQRGSANYSAYVFRDRNRDGRLNLGDKPMTRIVVEMTSPGGRTTIQRSNLNGFVNFEMSVFNRNAKIRQAGEYRFRTVVPPGWIVTSDNAEQICRFEQLPGAIADIIALNPTLPVGLAPELVIAGQLRTLEPDGTLAPAPEASLVAVNRAGGSVAVAVGADASFVLPVTPGRWRLIASKGASAPRVERDVEVRDAPVRLSAIVFGDPPRQPAPRRVEVDFESMTKSWLLKIPSGTAGVNWNYLNAIESVNASGEGYVNTATSGNYVAYSSSGHPVTLSRPGGFDFVGAYFGIAWSQAEGESLEIRAVRDGRTVGEEVVTLSSLGPVWFDADYRGVDEVTLKTRHYWQFVTDDLVVGVPGE